ncbi:unnamed protein product, partial [Amoebophrya sp. A120]|eukprot:GSA120T00013069001.1
MLCATLWWSPTKGLFFVLGEGCSLYVVRSRTFYPSGFFAMHHAKRPAVFKRAEVFLHIKNFQLSSGRGFANKQARSKTIDSHLIKRRRGAGKR